MNIDKREQAVEVSAATSGGDVPDSQKRFVAGVAQLTPVADPSCCSPSEQTTCCEPAAKASCCGDAPTGGCGCR